MSETEKSKLDDFLGSIAEVDLRKLVAAVEYDRLNGTRGLPHNTVLDALRPVLRRGGEYERIPTPQRMFCTAFEDLLQTLPRSQKQFGRVSRTTIVPVWDWLCTEAMPEKMLQVEEDITQLILDQEWEKAWEIVIDLQIEVGGLIKTVVDDAIREPSAFRSLNRHISDSLVLADMRDIAQCLLAAKQIRKIQTRFSRPIGQLTSRDVAWFDRLYQELRGHEERLSAYLLLCMMGRMAQPWQILTVIEMMSDLSGQHECYVADWQFVCEVLLSDLEHVSSYFNRLKIEKICWTELHENLLFFINVSSAIADSGELGFNDGWATRINSAKLNVVSEITRLLERLPTTILGIFSSESVGSQNGLGLALSFDEAPDPTQSSACISMAEFLSLCVSQSDHLELSQSVNAAVQTMYKNVRNLKKGIMEKIQACRGQERNIAIGYADLLAEISRELKPCFDETRVINAVDSKLVEQRRFGT